MDSNLVARPATGAADRPARVVVVGGGIAGLSTAFHLQEGARKAGRALDCTLVEGSERFGGKIVTRHEAGYTVEGGPDCFLTQKPWAVDLCRRLGLDDQLIGTNEAKRRVTILWKGKMHPLPDGVMLIVPTRFRPFVFSTLISPLGKARMGMDLFIPARRDGADESVANFVRRRLGQEALDKIAEPLLGGVHVSDPERQSLLATFPRFADIERKYGSMTRGMVAAKAARSGHAAGTKPLPVFMSLRGGLNDLIDALVRRLDGVRLLRGASVDGLTPVADGGFRLQLSDGALLEAEAVVLAMPARQVAPLVDGWADDLAARLRDFRYVSTATVSFGYRRRDLAHQLDGFGFLIPSKEKRPITGCTWSSTKFDDRAPAGGALVRCFLGGAADESSALLSEEKMVRLVRNELRSLMGITSEPALIHVHRWRDGHPQYDVGHLDRVAAIEGLTAQHAGLFLTGSSYRGVGMPDCIHNGALTAQAVLAGLPARV